MDPMDGMAAAWKDHPLKGGLHSIGLHRSYVNGLARPLLRGWLHTAVGLLGVLISITGVLPPAAHTFVMLTTFGYVASAHFHMVPVAMSAQVISSPPCLFCIENH
jgi:hypothetical protein